jgi:hypothetical protein
MGRIWIVVAGAVYFGALAGCAAGKASPATAHVETAPPPASVATATQESDGKIEQHHTVTMSAVVVAVDHDQRELTLRGPKGNTAVVAVGDEVRNLDQVRKGDHVVARYYEAVAVELKKPGEATLGVTTAEGGARAAKGEKPAAGAVRVVTITAKVAHVDRKNKTVTLTGRKGKSTVVDVQEPRYLDKVKKGDLVEITYTQALAISVEEVAHKKAH